MRDGRGTETRIRGQALALFVARGVDAVSVRDIAEAAGIRPSTLYVHWTSREALIADLFDTGYAEYGRRVAEIAAAAGSFRERFARVVRLICQFEAEDAILFNFLLLAQHTQLRRVPDNAATPIELIQRMVAAAMAEGEIPIGDPALMTAALVGPVLQAATFHVYGRLNRRLIDVADELVGICLKILA
jgi:AcrR family transcriptional regulator